MANPTARNRHAILAICGLAAPLTYAAAKI
jgi:hypothetical protein